MRGNPPLPRNRARNGVRDFLTAGTRRNGTSKFGPFQRAAARFAGSDGQDGRDLVEVFGHDEYAAFAPGMKSIDDALELRQRDPQRLTAHVPPVCQRRLPCARPCGARAALRAGKRRGAAAARAFGLATTRLAGLAAGLSPFAAVLAGRAVGARAGAAR